MIFGNCICTLPDLTFPVIPPQYVLRGIMKTVSEARFTSAGEKRHCAAALHGAVAHSATPLLPRGRGVRLPYAAFASRLSRPLTKPSVHRKLQRSRNGHCDHEPALPRTAAVSETSRSNARTPTVHGELQRSRNLHCDHEPSWSSPSPIPVPTRSGLEARAGERRPSLVAATVHGKDRGEGEGTVRQPSVHYPDRRAPAVAPNCTKLHQVAPKHFFSHTNALSR